MHRSDGLSGQPDPRLRSNLLFDATAWIGLGMTTALMGSLLFASARMAGMGPTALAVLTVVPFAASLVSVVSGKFGPRTARGLMLIRVVGSGSLLGLLLSTSQAAIVAIAAVFWVAYMLGMPFQQRVWGAIYPAQSRGRLLGAVGTARFAAGAIAIGIASLLAEHSGGLVVIAAAGGLGIVLALATAKLGLTDLEPAARHSVRTTLSVAIERPRLRAVLLGHGLYGAGLIAAIPLVTLLQVDRLHLTLPQIGTLGIGAACATTVASAAAIWMAGRQRTTVTWLLGSFMGAAGMLCYAAADSPELLAIAAIIVGASVGVSEVTLPVLIAERAGPGEQIVAAAGMQALWGTRGLIVPMATTALLGLGIADERGLLLACAATIAVGCLIFVRMTADDGLEEDALESGSLVLPAAVSDVVGEAAPS